jgi:hypothetical protein
MARMPSTSTRADIDDATELVFGGGSAGAKGALANADWFLSDFPDSDNSLVIDGMFDATGQALDESDVWVDWDEDGTGDEPWSTGRADYFQSKWEHGYYLAIDAFTDESCRDFYEPLALMNNCTSTSTMLRMNLATGPVIETPTFVRLDLIDPALFKFYAGEAEGDFQLLIGGANGDIPEIEDFAVIMRASLFDVYEDNAALTGMFAPRCGQHVALGTNHPFWNQTTPRTTNTDPITVLANSQLDFQETLWHWLAIGLGARDDIARIDRATGIPLSGC